MNRTLREDIKTTLTVLRWHLKQVSSNPAEENSLQDRIIASLNLKVNRNMKRGGCERPTSVAVVIRESVSRVEGGY